MLLETRKVFIKRLLLTSCWLPSPLTLLETALHHGKFLLGRELLTFIPRRALRHCWGTRSRWWLGYAAARDSFWPPRLFGGRLAWFCETRRRFRLG